jgi:hypothetical protein
MGKESLRSRFDRFWNSKETKEDATQYEGDQASVGSDEERLNATLAAGNEGREAALEAQREALLATAAENDMGLDDKEVTTSQPLREVGSDDQDLREVA